MTSLALGSGKGVPKTFSITSQANKHVLFVVHDFGKGETRELQLPINPSEKDVDTPWRTTATQTEGGAWVDDFGRGIPTITITGDTGWRTLNGRYNGSPVDGKQAYDHFYADILNGFFTFQSQSKDPDQVQMFMVDDVDNMVYKIVPTQSHQLQRSKTGPLLFRYTQNFIVVWMDIPGDTGVSNFTVTYSTPSNPYTTQASSTQQKAKTSVKKITPPPRTYVVKSGDNLWNICTSFYGRGNLADKLAAYNHIPNPNYIYDGQVLKIPYSL